MLIFHFQVTHFFISELWNLSLCFFEIIIFCHSSKANTTLQFQGAFVTLQNFNFCWFFIFKDLNFLFFDFSFLHLCFFEFFICGFDVKNPYFGRNVSQQLKITRKIWKRLSNFLKSQTLLPHPHTVLHVFQCLWVIHRRFLLFCFQTRYEISALSDFSMHRICVLKMSNLLNGAVKASVAFWEHLLWNFAAASAQIGIQWWLSESTLLSVNLDCNPNFCQNFANSTLHLPNVFSLHSLVPFSYTLIFRAIFSFDFCQFAPIFLLPIIFLLFRLLNFSQFKLPVPVHVQIWWSSCQKFFSRSSRVFTFDFHLRGKESKLTTRRPLSLSFALTILLKISLTNPTCVKHRTYLR